MHTTKWLTPVLAGILCGAAAGPAFAQSQETSPPPGAGEKLTLKRAVALAVENSRDVVLARLRQNVAEKSAGLGRSRFLPNLYTGTGAAYTKGFPLIGGTAPSLFNLSYVQTIFNPPLRGEFRAAEEQSEVQRLEVERTRDAVMVRTASNFLELLKVRHSLELLRRERESAQKITSVTRERLEAGIELPVEVMRAQLSAARIEQRIAQLEAREDTLELELHQGTGLPPGQPLDLVAEDLPSTADEPLGDLVQQALTSNLELKQAEFERRAREQRLKGERGGYWPTVDLVADYSVLSRFNNYDRFFRHFERNAVNAGVSVRIPIFSSGTSAAVALARSELTAVEISLKNKRSNVEIDIRRQARRSRELEMAREVARLELQLAQENLRVVQAQFQEGRVSLRDLEKARLEESDRWMAFLDRDYERQQAQLDLLRSTGRLASVLQ